MNTFKVHFLGCKTNQSDALGYAGVLQKVGWRESSDTDPADLVIVQTCTVTISADSQARQMVRRLKRENPQSKILLTGCYAQRSEKELSALPEVDYVIGNLNPNKYELLTKIAGLRVREAYADFPMPAESPRSRPYIKIQDGCDARCSYCIIPSVRGKSRSLPVNEVLRRVEHYRDRGYKEMILTGISMGGYGKDLSPAMSLSYLMKQLDSLPGNFRIRLSSLEPEEIRDDFLEVFTSSPRFQPHLHLPLQSASDKVLKRMRRQYLFRHYDSIVSRLFAAVPHLNLGTDLLVGFPDEDQDAFLKTRNYLKEAPFAYSHVFPFSSRPDTHAATYASAASHREISDRAEELRKIGAYKNLLYRQRFAGKHLGALVLKGGSEALTDNYIRLRLTDPAPQNERVSVKIEKIASEITYGSVVQPFSEEKVPGGC